jgi:hypothetical protein
MKELLLLVEHEDCWAPEQSCSEKKNPRASRGSDARCPASSKRLHFLRAVPSHTLHRVIQQNFMVKDCKATCIYKRTAITSDRAV